MYRMCLASGDLQGGSISCFIAFICTIYVFILYLYVFTCTNKFPKTLKYISLSTSLTSMLQLCSLYPQNFVSGGNWIWASPCTKTTGETKRGKKLNMSRIINSIRKILFKTHELVFRWKMKSVAEEERRGNWTMWALFFLIQLAFWYRVFICNCHFLYLSDGHLKQRNHITQSFSSTSYMDILIFWGLSMVWWKKVAPFRSVPK